jgi:hypothetical protein
MFAMAICDWKHQEAKVSQVCFNFSFSGKMGGGTSQSIFDFNDDAGVSRPRGGLVLGRRGSSCRRRR